MDPDRLRRTREEIVRLADSELGWVDLATAATEAVRRVIPFTSSCWHSVDPGTVLFTGSLNQNVGCSGSWLAEHEYVIEDVNRWWFLARSGRWAGATSLATHGDLSRSARHRSRQNHGFGDELRGTLVAGEVYWGAVGFLRAEDQPWFTEAEVAALRTLCTPLADGFRRALVRGTATTAGRSTIGPGVVVFDAAGGVESLSPAAEAWIEQLVEIPPPRVPGESKALQAVAAAARASGPDPIETRARSRVRTRSGEWLLLYGSRLSGAGDRTAVVLQPATRHEVAPLVALAYGLSEREREVARLCMQGQSTKQMAHQLAMSPYTVQDHLKSIFAKTGARSRGELVGQVFLEHYVPQWQEPEHSPAGWQVWDTPAR